MTGNFNFSSPLRVSNYIILATSALLVNVPLASIVLVPVFFVVPLVFVDEHEKNNENDKGNEYEVPKRSPLLGASPPKSV